MEPTLIVKGYAKLFVVKRGLIYRHIKVKAY